MSEYSLNTTLRASLSAYVARTHAGVYILVCASNLNGAA